jgi:mannose-6-phosphate isomerase-like protein (cupin superfamily)
LDLLTITRFRINAFGEHDFDESPTGGPARDELVKIRGTFVWHHHEKEDELLLCLSGRLQLNRD